MIIAELIDGWSTTWMVLGAVVLAFVVSAILTPLLVRRGLRTPAGLRILNQVSDRVVDAVKRPITVMVLDEVVDVLRTGHYTRNVLDAIIENEVELRALAVEKIREESGIRVLGHLPGYDRLAGQLAEAVIHVLVGMLDDPRMEEFVADILRNNLEQIQDAVHRREYEHIEAFRPAGS